MDRQEIGYLGMIIIVESVIYGRDVLELFWLECKENFGNLRNWMASPFNSSFLRFFSNKKLVNFALKSPYKETDIY